MSSRDLVDLVQELVAGRERQEDAHALAERLAGGDGRLAQIAAMIDDLEGAFDLLNEPADDPLPERIGRFRPLRLLGVGGFSRVYLAHDKRLRRLIALKVLSPDRVAAGGTAWIDAEGRSLAQLRHPHVVQVFDLDEEDGQPFVAMEYVPGTDLRSVIEALRSEREQPDAEPNPEVRPALRALATISARVRLAAQLARALAYCHGEGVIHRDVTPANVRLSPPAEPKWIDFGLAHVVDDARDSDRTRGFVGTPAYLAPEQVDRERTGADERSDVFSLGLVLYELLTLEHPFKRDSYSGTLAAISRGRARLLRHSCPDVPSDVERICMHALERRPEDRYPSAAALADDLEAFLEHRAISLRPPLVTYSLHLWLRRNRRRLALAAGVLAAALFVAAAAWLWRAGAERAELDASIAASAAGDDLRDADSETFYTRILALNELQERADELDAALAAAFFADRAPAVHPLWRDLHAALERRVPAEQARIRANPTQRIDGTWRSDLSVSRVGWSLAGKLLVDTSPLDVDPLAFSSLDLPPGRL